MAEDWILSKFWGQCYDHNFSAMFYDEIGVFLENQSYDQFFAQTGSILC
jgi:hypothetical protein